MLRAIILFLLGTMGFQLAAAQAVQFNTPFADSVMASYLKKINYWSSRNKNAPDELDSLVINNKRLMEYLENICSNIQTIDTRFPLAENRGLISITSEDHKLRVYAWDTWTGNTMHYFNSLAQFNTGNNAGVKILNDISDTDKAPDPGSYFSELNTIRTNDGRTVYLVNDYTIASKNEKANGIKAYSIEKGELKNTAFFKTKKLLTSYIDFVYNVSYDSMTSIIISIHLSPDKKKLFIPVVMKNGHLVNKYWLYVFKGDKYVFKKKVKGV